ncbi:hypothetical protein LDY77_18880, partial [Serratia marcescens]|nr:hypothetical protein [Serratia marcescens]
SDAGSNEHLYPGRATEAGQDSQSIFWLMCIGFELTCVDAYALALRFFTPNSATARPESKSWRRVGETASGLKLRNCLPCFFITQRSIDVSILRRYIVLIIINRPDNYFHLLRLLPAISGQIAR